LEHYRYGGGNLSGEQNRFPRPIRFPRAGKDGINYDGTSFSKLSAMSSSNLPSAQLPSVYIPHGGGPCFFMEWPGDPHLWDDMGAFLRGLARSMPAKPKAIVVVSAHWEEEAFTVTASARPPLLFDYYGFPPHTYELKYPAPGEPALAQRIVQLLSEAGMPARLDAARGFDHGVFIPLLLTYPEADIPVVQLSLKAGLDPHIHLAAGRALAGLRDEGALLLGSGMSFHNMQGFFRGGFDHPSRQFDQWLTQAVERGGDERAALLERWSSAPGARESHPREEHLLPLMVVAGAGGDQAGNKIFECDIKGSTISAFSFA
jgi:aromatic ring-opening dioxygenase catalytic subunit (LigB family)